MGLVVITTIHGNCGPVNFLLVLNRLHNLLEAHNPLE
jgi:hypothetical protein